jgi:two-component system, sensor histidine kinase and response regulator
MARMLRDSRLSPPSTEHAPARRTLLIVDDDEAPRQSLEYVFKKDYRVLLAEDGLAALAVIAREPIDAAIVDIRMPGMSGIELLAHIKETHPRIEVVILTGYETFETARQALRLGACDYLTKPADLRSMRSAVARAMQARTFSDRVREDLRGLDVLRVEMDAHRLRENAAQTRAEIYAGVMHDISSPLTAILGLTEILHHDVSRAVRLEGSDLEAAKEGLAQLGRHVSICVEMSQRYRRLLRGSRLPGASGGGASVQTLLGDLDELLRAHPLTRQHRLVIQVPVVDERVTIGSADLIQVLLNLAINAFHSSDSAVTVEISAEKLLQAPDLGQALDGPHDRYINVEDFDPQPPLIAITVRDSGPGIPAQAMPHLFQLYFTTKPQGVGLGLAVVQRLLKVAGGAMHLHSEPGRGATFTLFLPVERSPLVR